MHWESKAKKAGVAEEEELEGNVSKSCRFSAVLYGSVVAIIKNLIMIIMRFPDSDFSSISCNKKCVWRLGLALAAAAVQDRL